MAEALAMIGLASALIQFVEFGGKVLRQLRRLESDMTGVPTVFKNVRSRLPLMVDLVQKLIIRMDAGLIDKKSQETMLPVVRSCMAQAEQLDSLIVKTLPQHHESHWSRGRKAVVGVLVESDVERIEAALKANFDLLSQAGTFHLADGDMADTKKGLGGSSGMFNFLGSNVHVTLQSPDLTTSPPGYDVSETEHFRSPFQPPPLPEEPKDAPGAAKPPVFMVPFHRDSNFLGRRSTLDVIDQRFESQSYVALAGLGGIGKSQIAIEYAYLYRERYPEAHIFWVYASDPIRFEESYHHIARKMAFPGWDDHQMDTLQFVHDGLSSIDSGKWLLILDNADDESMFHSRRASERSNSRTNDSDSSAKSYARYIPNKHEGSVLITTRDRRVGERLSGRHRPIDISVMTPGESMELLRSKMIEEDWCEKDAHRLVMELSHLPLAITQAAAFISENCLSIDEYLTTLRAGDDDAKELLSEHLEDSRRDIDTENSVVRTWKLSFDQILRNVPRAAEVLSLVAVLDYHSVPVSLLRKDKETETGFRIALGALQAFSLLTASRGRDAVCKTHRLVSLAMQRWLEARGTLSYWHCEGLRALAKAFPGPGCQKYKEWPLYEALVPHTAQVLACQFEAIDDLLLSAQLMVAVGLYQMSRCRFEKAFELCQRSYDICRDLLPADDPLALDSVQTLGEALLHRGELQLAAAMLSRAVAGREKALGVEDPDTLESLSDLTITLMELDDLDAAEATALRALDGRQRVLGDHHQDTIVSLNIHTILLHRKGKLEEAATQYEKTLQLRERLLGAEHPDTIITRNNFARLQYDQGNLQGARTTIDRVLAGEAEALGPEGYDSQVSLSTSALIQAAQGDSSGAVATLRRVLKIRDSTLGQTHPSTLFTLQMIKDLYEDLASKGGSHEALRELQSMMEGRQQRLIDGTPQQATALLRAGLLFD
ncbi:TPR-like protein [Colletotrichum scovillei]|uniref:TPR-like protein n=1 Tax=Colletotrichum scovillei TaxID=1209932 RepID=A0A9P7REH3_9PEZI|nr:TPR-like protein [Colletotrichum scovillei]KAG7075312.1 TPR-like protein [Colletotrichum scovillei]KAG7082299.1 TPR-like protein [Colletotrichum scovillei]